MAEAQRRAHREYRKGAGESSPAESPKRSRSTKWLVFFCLAVLVVYSFATGLLKLPSFGIANPSSAPSLSEAYLSSTYNATFFEFTHPVYGFKAKYPIGYAVTSSNSDMSAARFFAFGADEMPVSVYFLVINESVSKKDMAGFASELATDSSNPSTLLWNGSATYGSNSYYLIKTSYYSNDAGENLFLSYAIKSCPKYNVIIEGIVPERMIAEQPVINTVLESFECGS